MTEVQVCHRAEQQVKRRPLVNIGIVARVLGLMVSEVKVVVDLASRRVWKQEVRPYTIIQLLLTHANVCHRL